MPEMIQAQIFRRDVYKGLCIPDGVVRRPILPKTAKSLLGHIQGLRLAFSIRIAKTHDSPEMPQIKRFEYLFLTYYFYTIHADKYKHYISPRDFPDFPQKLQTSANI